MLDGTAIVGQVVDDGDLFHAPAQFSLVDGLIDQYNRRAEQIRQVGALFQGDVGGVVRYFLEGNRDKGSYSSLAAERIFGVEGAIAALNSDYWSRALALTDCLEAMPQARRSDWQKQLDEHKTPAFETETVRATLESLLSMRTTFFAERIDGIFRRLSRSHVSNSPMGFRARLIVDRVITYYDTIDHETAGYINDLRCVVAKFMGRDDPSWQNTRVLLDKLRSDTGTWHSVDGGAVRIRLYKKGTAHLEIHPDVASRLNGMLAYLYPHAIPAEHRTRATSIPKHFHLMQNALSFNVLAHLENGNWRNEAGAWVYYFAYDAAEKAGFAAAQDAMRAVGGVCNQHRSITFDYDARPVVTDLVITGCLPDHVSHQFYPTKPRLAQIAVELAEIDDACTVLEPQAGQGGIADYLPKERTTCVEVSSLFCGVLRAKGFKTINADFLEWATTAPMFDRVVLNPPYSKTRAALHVRAASGLIAPGGKLVAILPGSMRGDSINSGWEEEWSEPYSDEFDGTGVTVAIYIGRRPLA